MKDDENYALSLVLQETKHINQYINLCYMCCILILYVLVIMHNHTMMKNTHFKLYFDT